ncbi:MAG: beta-glycosidase [Muribaculaceae bacterium]|nr:beta-glycosidase [Muribaculaceae bacterium]
MWAVKINAADRIDLSGQWHYSLPGAPPSIPGEGYINLPNTLDNARKSIPHPPVASQLKTDELRRVFSFVGEASYSRPVDIPPNWKGKEIFLTLESTKPTRVSVDGKPVGSNSRISSAQHYNLTEFLSPGSHRIEVTVNNADSIPPIVARSSHAVSESTQTNWNGILGGISLEARNPFHIRGIKIDDKKEEIKIEFSRPAPLKIRLGAEVSRLPKSKPETGMVSPLTINPGDTAAIIPISLSPDMLWSAENPNLYDFTFKLTDTRGREVDSYSVTTGFRDFAPSGTKFTINGEPVFLLGTVNAAVFPETTHAPPDLESWIDYFSIIKSYGFNHVRFHSWTPPEAAFAAADQLGIYILTELPIWGELDRDLNFHNRFLKEELKGIMEAYAHHPSFVMLSPGNELFGDISLMREYMEEARLLNPRVLTTYGSNVYLGMNGEIGGEDFIVAAKTGDGPSSAVRGSLSFADDPKGGILNSSYPSSNFNYDRSTSPLSVPLIIHEAGQYQMYPDFSEIDKYQGNLQPDNLIEFRDRAEVAGTLRKNRAFAEATGKWAAQLYRAEIEAAMRSQGVGGIEIFGLQDYPGQGTALVGILDPFMDSKGLADPRDWRQNFTGSPILALFPKFTFNSGETVEIPILGGDQSYITLTMPDVAVPRKETLILRDKEGMIKNKYDYWVYPKKLPKVDNVLVTTNLQEALKALEKGGRVILMPDSSTVAQASLEPLFTPDFWNYRMYRTICDEMHLPPSPGTLGLYIDKEHPALAKFPTESHTDWQWYEIVANSRPLIIDRLPADVDPVVEVVDNVERNFRLALMLECNVGKGKLMIISSDLEKASEYPEGRWLLQSVKEYMASKDCKPEITLTPQQVVNLLTKPSNARLIKELKNETYRKF